MDGRRNIRRISSKLIFRLANVCGVGVAGAVLYGVSVQMGRRTIHASSSTSSNPEVPPVTRDWDTNWDRRDPKHLVKELGGSTEASYTPTVSRHILLIRHGQYFDNGNADKDRFLTNLGRSQAEMTGKRLKDLDLPYIHIISSTMTRAVETAKLIHKHLPELSHITDDSLREGAPFSPEPASPPSWKPEPKQFFQDGARIESAFRKYFFRADPSQKEDSCEIIVCHSNVIRYFICRVLQFPPSAWLRFSLAHGSATLVTIQTDGLAILEMIGDHGHMPPSQISFT